jgi:hypothetical protein
VVHKLTDRIGAVLRGEPFRDGTTPPAVQITEAAHQAIRELGAELNSGQPIGLSGRTVTVVAEDRVADRRPADVFRYVQYPMNWMSKGGHPAERPGQAFHAWLAPPSALDAEGQLLEVRPSRTVVFTWAFTRSATPGTVIGAPQPDTGHLPPGQSMTIETRLRRSRADTVVTITSRGVPVEWSGRAPCIVGVPAGLREDLCRRPFPGRSAMVARPLTAGEEPVPPGGLILIQFVSREKEDGLRNTARCRLCIGMKTPPGPKLTAIIDARTTEMAARYSATYPSAMKCLLADREGLTAYLRFPAEHHHRIRHSNFIERTFGETRRRVKVIGRLPGETSCLSLVWAVLDRASRGWRGFTMTSDGLRLLHDLRRSLLEQLAQTRPRTVITSQPGDTNQNVSAIA